MNIQKIIDFYTTTADKELLKEIKSLDLKDINKIAKLKSKYSEHPIADLLTLKRIRKNASKRISRADEYVFTVKGVEQSSSSEVAKFHRSLFHEDDVVADICCGNGIDLLSIASRVTKVYAIDMSNEAISCAKYNSHVEGLENIIFMEIMAEEFNNEVTSVFIDPDRRPDERRVINGEDISPNFKFVEGLISKYQNVIVKLSPVFDYKSVELNDVKHSWLFVSEKRVLKEVLLCTGKYAVEEHKHIACILPDKHFGQSNETIEVSPIKEYILEPDVAIIRSGLVQDYGSTIKYNLINKHIAILTGDEPVISAWGRCYKVLSTFHYNKKNLNTFVKQNKIGQLVIKVRGFPETPQQIMKKLKLKGKSSALIQIIRMDKEFICLELVSLTTN